MRRDTHTAMHTAFVRYRNSHKATLYDIVLYFGAVLYIVL